MNHPAVDTVVYDFGNVLVRWDPRGAYSGLDPAEVDRFFAEFDFMAFNLRQDAGRPFAEGRAEVARTHPRWAPLVDTYLERYADTLGGPVPGSADLVTELKQHGLRLYGLTNWWAETFHHAAHAAPAVDLMDGVVVSGRVGLAKPDPAIFEHLCERFDVDPARAVFVDDSPVNVQAAAALGFHALHFTTTDTLRQDLRALGLPVTTR
ncbi:HAD family phosphatase [Xylanimonas oleitrophica]|uniref:HAD family phosphatase n=1 Tax=Xylanimonas oleitrophica TaxID=2607479 RepID=A0A2W5WP62_9MICO|nr:HAD family phosphatase [Xylanimonas oleitrophica]PZR52772.1 HAD family phosphatase [Xylanimonas oleitrophica]